MSAGRSDGNGALGHLLAAHVGKIFFVAAKFFEEFADARGGWFDVELLDQKRSGLSDAVDGDHVDPLDDRCFGGVGARDDQAAKLLVGCGGHRHREGAFHGAHRAIEGQLADDGVVGEEVGGDLTASSEEAKRDGEVERRGLFGELGRGTNPLGKHCFSGRIASLSKRFRAARGGNQWPRLLRLGRPPRGVAGKPRYETEQPARRTRKRRGALCHLEIQ